MGQAVNEEEGRWR
jgi:hypothetical protein